MKSLNYFEKKAEKLRENGWDYKLISFSELVISCMQDYRRQYNIPWVKFKPVYDAWFEKYHN